MKPLPTDSAQTNAGQKCDMADGPCACGAWHEQRPKQEVEGYSAYAAGKNSDANPYPRGTVSHECWFVGWANAGDADPERNH